jgi:hypothetical protein
MLPDRVKRKRLLSRSAAAKVQARGRCRVASARHRR